MEYDDKLRKMSGSRGLIHVMKLFFERSM